MTDTFVDADGSKTLVLTVNLGPGAQLGLVSGVLTDIATLLGAGAALDRDRQGSRPPNYVRNILNDPFGLSTDSYFGGRDLGRRYPRPLFDIPDNVFRLEQVTFENPAVVTGILSGLAGMGIPSILRIVRDWKTDRQIQLARAEDATHRQAQGARLREAVVDKILEEMGAANPGQVNAIVGASVEAIDRLMGAGLEVRGIGRDPKPPRRPDA